MTQTADNPVSDLRSRMQGEVVGSDDPTYDDSRECGTPASIAARPWSPDAPARPTCRRSSSSRPSRGSRSRCGGAHSMSGACVVDDGIMIDLSRMNQVPSTPPPGE